MFRKVSFATITSLLTVGWGRMLGVLASPINPWVTVPLVQSWWVLSRHHPCQMWAAQETQHRPAEPGAVSICLPAARWHGGCWGVNTPLSLGLQPSLPPQGLSGLMTKEEMAAFMSILLRHHRPSSLFFFSSFFFWKHGVLEHCCLCFSFLLLPREPGLMTQKLLKTSRSPLPQSGDWLKNHEIFTKQKSILFPCPLVFLTWRSFLSPQLWRMHYFGCFLMENGFPFLSSERRAWADYQILCLSMENMSTAHIQV